MSTRSPIHYSLEPGRALTDFAYCCYLSDLAVDVAYQRQGIGRQRVENTRAAAGRHSTLILVAAPAAQARSS